MPKQFLSQVALVGLAGTGTTTIAKLLGQSLFSEQWKRVSPASDTFRSLAIKMYPSLSKGEALKKFEQDSLEDLSIDLRDAALAELARTSHIIADARLAAKFLPRAACHVYLKCDDQERISRVAKRENKPFEVARKETLARERSAMDRYKDLYGIRDLLDQASGRSFDLVIDTATTNENGVVEVILDVLRQRLNPEDL